MASIIRQIAKTMLPSAILDIIRSSISPRKTIDLSGLTTADVFSQIYNRNLWGVAPLGGRQYWSGSGSHDSHVVRPYVDAVRNFLSHLDEKPIIADLGCGDFNVGSKFLDLVDHCIACDIFEGVIYENKRVYASIANVDFRTLDLGKDPLPRADVIVVRQVLQHLNNSEIAAFAAKAATACRYLIVTEHHPKGDFLANVDIGTGAGTRTSIGSGVLLTEAPFSLQVQALRVLCEALESGGVVRTMLYDLVPPGPPLEGGSMLPTAR